MVIYNIYCRNIADCFCVKFERDVRGDVCLIISLDIGNKEIASEVLKIQIPAYKVEAELIRFNGIPQLFDTEESLANSGETFIGFVSEGVLQGVLAYCENENQMEICRLIVHPAYFKRGIATKLLAFFLQELVGKTERVIVSTGADNYPAKALYKKFGFTEIENREVAPNVWITELQMKKA